MAQERLIWLDIAKAICIVLVVIGHFMPEFSTPPNWWVTTRNVIYSFHMPFFIFASGIAYVMSRKNDYFQFLKKKFFRLVVPYFTVSIIIIGAKVVASNLLYVENPKGWQSLLKMFYYPEAGFFLWFIWVLILAFLIVPLFKSRVSRLALLVVSVALYFLPIELPSIFCLDKFKEFFCYFMLGVACMDYKPKTLMKYNFNPAYIITVFAIGYYLVSLGNAASLPFTSMLLAIVGIFMIISVAKFIETKRVCINAFVKISAASYVIYLLHTTFMGMAKAVITKVPTLMNISNDFIFTIDALFVGACGVTVPLLLYKVFKKSKATRFLFGL